VAERQDHGDPESPHWGGLAWSRWHQLDSTAERGLVPQKQGIYRLRCQGHPALIYVGISDRLSSRLGGCVVRAATHLAIGGTLPPPAWRVTRHKATSSRCRGRCSRTWIGVR